MDESPTDIQADIGTSPAPDYDGVLADIAALLEDARRAAARSVNAVMTACYWQIGRRLVEVEQGGEARAEYGAQVLKRLSADLTQRFGRGFSERNLEQMRLFYRTWPIPQTLSAESAAAPFPLSWSHYVRLLYHRRLRCLVIIDLKIGAFDPADGGQMNLYVNYAAEHLTLPDENRPVGLILCSEPDAAVARYALGGMDAQILAAEYRLALPDPAALEAELARTRRLLEGQ